MEFSNYLVEVYGGSGGGGDIILEVGSGIVDGDGIVGVIFEVNKDGEIIFLVVFGNDFLVDIYGIIFDNGIQVDEFDLLDELGMDSVEQVVQMLKDIVDLVEVKKEVIEDYDEDDY